METELKPISDFQVIQEVEDKLTELEAANLGLQSKLIVLEGEIAAKDLEIATLKLLLVPVTPTPIVIPPPIVINERTRCDNFTKNFTFPAECAYVHHSQCRIPEDVTWEDVPGDNGGVTKWGIDQGGHPNLFTSYIKMMTMQEALDIYYQEWTAQRCVELPSPIAEVVHDTFESGGRPIRWLQTALDDPDPQHAIHWLQCALRVQVDGLLGPDTLASVKAVTNPAEIAHLFLIERDSYFVSLANHVAHDAQFKQGWLNRDNNLRKFLGLS